jgi:hypothetical protein
MCSLACVGQSVCRLSQESSPFLLKRMEMTTTVGCGPAMTAYGSMTAHGISSSSLHHQPTHF